MAQLIFKRDYPLLRESTIVQNRPLLIKVLDEFRDTELRQEDIQKFDEATQKELRQIPRYRKEAELEWEPLAKYKRLPKRSGRCSRCNAPIRHIYYVRNIKTDVEYMIGRECKKHFEGLFKGIDFKKIYEAEDRLYRASQLDDKFPYIEQIINDWKKVLDVFITIPNDIQNPYVNAGVELKKAYYQCIEKGFKPKDLRIIKEILEKKDDYIADITKYISRNSSNQWAGNRKIEKWLFDNRINFIYNSLRRGGVITKEIAEVLYEQEFMNMISDKLRFIFNKKGIAGWAPRERGYLIKITNYDIRLICNHKQLINKYWTYILEEKECDQFNIKDILDISTIYRKDYSKIEKTLSNSFKYSVISVFKINHDRNEVVLREKNRKDSFIRMKLDVFIDLCKPFLFNNSKDILDNAIYHIQNVSSTRYIYEDIKGYESEFKREIYEIQRTLKRK